MPPPRAFLALALFLLSFAAPAQLDQEEQYQCRLQVTLTWNQFVRDANAYIHELDQVHDLKLRKRVEKDWGAVTRSECW